MMVFISWINVHDTVVYDSRQNKNLALNLAIFNAQELKVKMCIEDDITFEVKFEV